MNGIVKTNVFDEINKDFESELRFGYFSGTKFIPGITLENFIKIQRDVHSFAKFKSIEYSFIANHKNGERVTQYLEPNNEILGYPWKNKIIGDNIIIKEKIKTFDTVSLGVRYSISKETVIKNINTESNPGVYFKSRKRFTYTWKNIVIDISMFKSSNNINTLSKQPFQYDIELEIIEKDKNNVFFMIEKILKISQNSNVVMSFDEIDFVRNSYEKIVHSKKFVGCQPQTLSLNKLKPEKYAMTLKLDGKRSFLIILDHVCYTINNKLQVSNFGIKTNDLDNTVIDGELYKGKFYCFDILFDRGKDVREKNLTDRIALVTDIVDYMSSKNVKVKEYYYENIYNTIQTFLIDDNVTDNSIDGFILVSVDKPYSHPPLKWKPDSLNTIDFKIRKLSHEEKHETWELLCSNNTPFVYNSNDMSKVKIPKSIAQNYMDGVVVEFSFDKNKEQFYPLKPRFDKTQGNYIDIAVDNFNTLMNPFMLENLKDSKKRKDMSFFNMRRYHNWIKRSMIAKYVTKSNHLLDLACGKGGDIQKWVDNNIKHVEGYDINTESIKEAVTRYNKVISKPTSKNFEYSFEVKDLCKDVVKSKSSFDAATCFFAIHYFYKDRDSLNTFMNSLDNIKEDGYVLITTLDNKSVKELDTDELKISNIKYNDDGGVLGNSFEVFIKDSVLDVSTKEYLVDYDFTVSTMKNKGFSLIESKTFGEYYKDWKEYGNFLNFTEKNYSFMNRSYVFQKTKNYKIQELKKICKENNLPVSGKKEELLLRIQKLKIKN